MRKPCLHSTLLSLLAFGLYGVVRGQTTPPAPEAKALMDQVNTAYRQLTALHEKLSFKTSGIPGNPGEIPQSAELRFQNPNRIWLSDVISKSGKTIHRLIVCDGVTLWRWQSDTNVYTRGKAPATFVQMSNIPDDAPDFEAVFQKRDPFEGMTSGAQLTVGKPTKLGNLDVDVLEVNAQTGANATGKLTLRMLMGHDDHLLRNISFEISGKEPQSGKAFSFQGAMSYDLVDMKPTFTASDFKFIPPPGAKPSPAPNTKTSKKR